MFQICYKEGAKNVFRKYKDMMAQLTTFEDDVTMLINFSASSLSLQLNKLVCFTPEITYELV
jgi:hypothetical protein